jgi:hypothetical protein
MDDMGYCRDVSFGAALCANATKLRFDHAVGEEGMPRGGVMEGCVPTQSPGWPQRNESGIMGRIDEDGQEIYF